MTYLNIISKRFDKSLVLLIFSLCGLGTVMMYSASVSESLNISGGLSNSLFLQSHIKKLLLGFFSLIFFANLDYRKIKPFSPYILFLSIAFLIATKVSYLISGDQSAARWLNFGLFSLQTSDFARLSLIIYLAYYIDKKKEKIKDFYSGLAPAIVIIYLILLIILFQPDFSTAFLIATLGFLLLFIGGAKLSHLSLLTSLSIIALIPLLLMKSYRLKRVIYWISTIFNNSNLESDLGTGHQIQQSLISLGNGGFFGLGPGNSMHKNLFLPKPHNDFIFSIIGEELGLWGAMIVLSIFLFLFQRGIKIAKGTTDTFGILLSIGIVTSLSLYAFINVGYVTGILPVTGLPIPLISHGGSNLIITLSSLGILLNISESKRSIGSKFWSNNFNA